MLSETPAQTSGPYVHIGTFPTAAGLTIGWNARLHELVRDEDPGEHIEIKGMIYDGGNAPVTDAMIEIWQADTNGGFHRSAFPSWGRAVSDFTTGEWTFRTVRPGPVPRRDGSMMAPHVMLAIFARGVNGHLSTLMYFPDDPDANSRDPILSTLEPARQMTLVAKRQPNAEIHSYSFDIFLQGDCETVFFNI
jgi:protocatechuate 3,4-dioxygenase alpha subunit